MHFAICSVFCLFLSYAPLSLCFQIPFLNTYDCLEKEEQLCDKEAIAQADVTSINSTLMYYLFTRKNPTKPEMLHLCNGTLPKYTNFDPRKKLIMFTTGFFFGVCQIPIVKEIKDEYLKKGDFNVILTDPTKEYGFDYTEAFEKMPRIAKEVAKVLQNIQDQTGIKNDQVELAGHSLGAQLSGLIAQHFPVHRITGVDPAGVRFLESIPANLRLDPSDAYLVDILHCNGGSGVPDFAIEYPAGDADFFINGGKLQHNCKDLAIHAMKGLDMLAALVVATGPTVCSHLICLNYYHASINNDPSPLYAWECDNYEDFEDGKCSDSEPVIMGYNYEKNFTQGEIDKPFPIKYYLSNGNKWPFGTKKSASSSKGKFKLF